MDWRDKLSGLKADLSEGEEIVSQEEHPKEVKKQREPLRVELDKRNGKPTTLITNFEGSDDELKVLAKSLKTTCGSGGSARGGEILIQGDFRVKIAELLLKEGFKVKKINF